MKTALFSMLLLVATPQIQDDTLSIQHKEKEIKSIYVDDYVSPIGAPFLNESKLNELTQSVKKQMTKDPINAYIGEDNAIVPGKQGYTLYSDRFRDQVKEYLYDPKRAQVAVPLMTTHPEVDAELLARIRTKQLGYYVTYFNHRNEERTHNIELSAKAIDSHVVFPNQVFSFNEVVGKRTKEKGYKSAPVIVKGEVTEGIGGGICQVSSTLYNAVDQARVKIVERYSHSKQVPYVPPGRDATVSWYGPDFTFKNTHDQPILIRAKVVGGQMVISIFSSNEMDIDRREVPKASEELPEEMDIENGLMD